MLKRKLSKLIVLTLSLLIIGTLSVFAATYDFYFEPPFAGSIQHSLPSEADGAFTPYVCPYGTTNATTYVLTQPEYNSTSTVSNYITDVTSGIHYFTYETGYGGSGQDYKLSGYPSDFYFQQYTDSGNWKP